MYYLYYSKAQKFNFEKNEKISVLFLKSEFFKMEKKEKLWWLLSLGRFQKCVATYGNSIAHESCVIGKNFKFPFLSKTEAEIGPCFTYPQFRGKGIYPYVLKKILSEGGYNGYYMLVHEDNTASIKGIEKAGFKRVGFVEKKNGKWIRKQYSLEVL